ENPSPTAIAPHATRLAPVIPPRRFASVRLRLPRLTMIETVTYGRTVICSSFTNPSAIMPSGATSSPRNRPTRMPAARPTRICREKVMPETPPLRRYATTYLTNRDAGTGEIVEETCEQHRARPPRRKRYGEVSPELPAKGGSEP